MTGLTLAHTTHRAEYELVVHSCYTIMWRPAQAEQQRTDTRSDTMGTKMTALQEYESHFDQEAMALWNALQSTEDFPRSPSPDYTLAQVCEVLVTPQTCVTIHR